MRRAAVIQRADEESALLSTAPSNALVDQNIEIGGALGRIAPKVNQKGWTRGTAPSTRPGYLATYTHTNGATLEVWDVPDESIRGQYTGTGGPHAESYITYSYENGRAIKQGYMKSYPEKAGIGTVLCHEGLRHARQQGSRSVIVSMANKNSAPLVRMLLPDESSSCCSCCFLVTACAEARRLPADCEELLVLRRFRDEYMLTRTGGAGLVALYYQVAPPILAGLRASEDPEAEFESIYSSIRRCVGLIAAGELEPALQLYRSLVAGLAQRFLEPEVFLAAQAIVAGSPSPA